MSLELSIFKLFCENREIKSIYFSYISNINNLEKDIKLLFNLVDSYYSKYEDADSVTKDNILSFYEITYPLSKSKSMHEDLIRTSFALDVDAELIKISLDQLIEKHTATTIINKLVPVMEGEKYNVLDSVRDDIDDYIELLSNPPDSVIVPTPCSLTVEELVERELVNSGIPWHLDSVTSVINGARRKRVGLIYAYVDSGKTSFAMSACGAFARGIEEGENICYCGNEEDSGRLKLRLVQAITNRTRVQILENVEESTEIATKGGLNKINIFEDITLGEQVVYVLKEYKPTVLFVDQATDVEIKTKRKSEGPEYLKQLFKWYRKLSATYDCQVVGVVQGVGVAENTKWLKLSDIYGSRVGIQGALDWAMGIGRIVDDPVLENFRYLNFPKNKEGSNTPITVHFDKQRCLWEDI